MPLVIAIAIAYFRFMKISEKLHSYHVMLSEMIYTGPESLEKIKTIAEESVYAITFRVVGNKILDELAQLCIDVFIGDINMITNMINYDIHEAKEGDFYDAKSFLLNDLKGFALVINDLGY